MTTARQCPFCELKFAERWELKMHLDAEHPGRITERDPHVIIEDPDIDDPKPL